MLLYLSNDDKNKFSDDSNADNLFETGTNEANLRVIVGIVDWGDLANPWEARYVNL